MLAIGGFGYLAWDERRRPRSERPARPSREKPPRRTNVPAGSQRPTRKERREAGAADSSPRS